MKRIQFLLCSTMAVLSIGFAHSFGQQITPSTVATGAAQTAASAVVPHLAKFSGRVNAADGKPLAAIVGVTFALYSDEQGGAPLWLETQNVQLDSTGHYTVLLGSTKPDGLPAELFATGEARWIGVQPSGQKEQPRVLLLSVPYALKAADAETLGGLPPSAFLLAAQPAGVATDSAASTGASPGALPPAGTVTLSGTISFVPLWTSSSNLGNSVLFQSGSGSTAKVGINTTTPASTFDVKGGGTIRGVLQLPSTGTATANAGFNSQPLNLQASSFNKSTGKAISQAFQWQAEPSGNDTSTPSGTLNLLFGSGSSKPTETGLKISSKGLFTFAAGQTFPGTGTIAGVTAGTDLTGGGTSGNVTLNLDTTKVPLLTSANTFVGNQTITGNLSDTGNISAAGSISGQTGVFSTNSSTTSVSITQNGIGIGLQSGGVTPLAILGVSNATGGNSFGVYGIADPVAGTGVAGQGNFGVLGNSSHAGGAGVFGGSNSSTGVAVLGVNSAGGNGGYFSSSNVAMYAYSRNGSIERSKIPAPGVAVWGDTGSPGGYAGVTGTADDSNAGLFFNSSPNGWTTLYAQSDESFNNGNHVLETFGSFFGGRCYIDVSGNLVCTGTKSAVVPVDGGTRKVALYAVESPENWFEDFGSGKLTNGAAVIDLEATFSQTVNTGMDYHVFLTPNDECKGLYVTRKTAGSFEVRELGGGKSEVDFDYRIVARRKGYESIRLADKTKQIEAPAVARRSSEQLKPPILPLALPVPQPKAPIPGPIAQSSTHGNGNRLN